MSTISLCMIVKNEEAVLDRCLSSIHDLVEEIIIVDTGSTDKTKAIAGKFTNKIFDFEWIDDFSAARNYSFSKASMDYIMWLDADDVLLEEDREKFKKVKSLLNPSVDIVMMKYDLGVKEDGTPTLSFYRERLLKRSLDFQWHDPVHEYLILRGKIVNSDVHITHKKERSRSDRNLKIFEKMLSEGKELNSRHYFYYARELNHNSRYDDAIIYYNKFLATSDGFYSNYLDACIDLADIYKIKNEPTKSLHALFRSFEFDLPRAEICCKIGYYFKQKDDYQKALYWFQTATTLKKPDSSRWGFVMPDFWDFIPYMELSICYCKIGNIAEAIMYNEKAAIYKPDHIAVLKNRQLLFSLQGS